MGDYTIYPYGWKEDPRTLTSGGTATIIPIATIIGPSRGVEDLI